MPDGYTLTVEKLGGGGLKLTVQDDEARQDQITIDKTMWTEVTAEVFDLAIKNSIDALVHNVIASRTFKTEIKKEEA